jgi:hypothetical protein
MTTTMIPATPRQIQYLTSLMEDRARVEIALDRDNGPETAMVLRERVADILDGRITLGKFEASAMIDVAKEWLVRFR